jgi:hypothetical protein
VGVLTYIKNLPIIILLAASINPHSDPGTY